MSFRKQHGVPDLGIGIGFRAPHRAAILESPELPENAAGLAAIDWFEVISENYLGDGGRPLATLDRLSTNYPVIPHGVSLNLGGTDRLNTDHLRRLRRLVDRLDAPWFSDHLCFTAAHGVEVHDLLPLPCTEKVADWVADRIRAVCDAIGRPFLLENPSSYVSWRADAMPEWEFLSRIAERADCGLLFDVNNVFVAATNHGFDPRRYIDGIDPERVVQIHLAGHSERPIRGRPKDAAGARPSASTSEFAGRGDAGDGGPTSTGARPSASTSEFAGRGDAGDGGPTSTGTPGFFLFDTHSRPVADAVWSLYRRTIARTGPVTTLIEWDEEIPAFPVVAAEAAKARVARQEATLSSVGTATKEHLSANSVQTPGELV